MKIFDFISAEVMNQFFFHPLKKTLHNTKGWTGSGNRSWHSRYCLARLIGGIGDAYPPQIIECLFRNKVLSLPAAQPSPKKRRASTRAPKPTKAQQRQAGVVRKANQKTKRKPKKTKKRKTGSK